MAERIAQWWAFAGHRFSFPTVESHVSNRTLCGPFLFLVIFFSLPIIVKLANSNIYYSAKYFGI